MHPVLKKLVDRLQPKPKTQVVADALVPGAPFFLMVGSLRDCTKKDALSYARGLAERYVTAPPLGRIHVQEDKANNRFLYEVHEGGPGLSILDAVLKSKQDGKEVRIQLANGGYVAVEDENGELYSLIYPEEGTEGALDAYRRKDNAGPPEALTVYATGRKLEEAYPERKSLPVAGSMMLIVSFTLCMVTGAAFVLAKSGVLHPDALLNAARAGNVAAESDNPVWQMEKAKQEGDLQGKAINTLIKDAKGWHWELN